MQIEIGVAKINKYATAESGDTIEVVERPMGGMSVVMADGQRSGKSAKILSNIVVRKVISLLAEGVRDGAAARAASDYLYSQKGGKVQSTLNIFSIDLETKSIVISRNNSLPVYIYINDGIQQINDACNSVGIYKNTKPHIYEQSLIPNIKMIAFTDGLFHAGVRTGDQLDIQSEFLQLSRKNLSAQIIADELIAMAIETDNNRPVDDISVIVINIAPDKTNLIRRLSVNFPVGI
jgi:serine phosphatase RsbU (regulator of sigma subunit)